ncbi:MAG TPA: hypothetical protein VFZ56_09640 [Gemmatimonadaceae bacterium]
MRHLPRLAGTLLPVLLASLPAAAQPVGREVVECRGQPITTITIETRPPFTPDPSDFVTRTATAMRRIHATTRQSLVKRYLALTEGMPCSELRRAESERILRAQPFIADAAVVAYSDGPDNVAIHVTTVDELSLILDGSVSGSSPHVRAIRAGNANLFGAGLYGAAHWRDGRGFRDGYGVRLVHHQLFGRPYMIEFDAVRRNVGHDVYVEASHPYLTELQRIAWRTHYGVKDGYTHFLRQSDTAAWLGLRQIFGDVGGVIRIGGPGLLLLVGGSLSHERDTPASSPVVLDAGEIRPDTGPSLVDRYPVRRQTRVNALVGFRDLRFMQVRGFQSLDGVQDVAKGLQLSGLLGRGMTMLDSRSDRGVFVSTSLYGGFGSPAFFGSLDVTMEGRREAESRSWVGVISSGRLAVYSTPFPRHTIVSSTEWTGGRRSRVPFQLTFADPEGGLRGYRDSRVGGAYRMVTRLEDRYLWGGFRRYATLGVAAFTDVGKLWPGDAPYGVNSKVSASVGLSLLASVPPRSQRLLRLDIAYPLNPDVGRTWEVRFTSQNAARLVWREPRDVRNARERSVPTNVFNWP